MCQSIAKGGQRCAAHTRPAYQAAEFGSVEWDDAAAAYAATREGQKALIEFRETAKKSDQIEQEIAAQAALDRGAALRAAAEEFRHTMLLIQQNPDDRPIEQRGNALTGLHQEWRDTTLRHTNLDSADTGLHHPRHEAVRQTGGQVEYRVGGRLHRVGEPALTRPDGHEEYWENGRRNRPDGLPAVITRDGDKEYWVNDRLHRDGDLPAKEGADGSFEHWKHGRKSRGGDLPAVKTPNGFIEYWVDGEKHRDGDLPAVIAPDGRSQYWRKGEPGPYKMTDAQGNVTFDADRDLK